eukprot:Unigene11489_Nuclearia_a/m.35025 Unigene11489_Nuclearia_a/g.35025  ORF Unigene11489_Nuclearia_a/g.35025 Unigene11489_Nuclearia_a/m.35025 type:complete len:430 (-) Unigene11489_Nuclearia_a:520-1809(-)
MPLTIGGCWLRLASAALQQPTALARLSALLIRLSSSLASSSARAPSTLSRTRSVCRHSGSGASLRGLTKIVPMADSTVGMNGRMKLGPAVDMAVITAQPDSMRDVAGEMSSSSAEASASGSVMGASVLAYVALVLLLDATRASANVRMLDASSKSICAGRCRSAVIAAPIAVHSPLSLCWPSVARRPAASCSSCASSLRADTPELCASTRASHATACRTDGAGWTAVAATTSNKSSCSDAIAPSSEPTSEPSSQRYTTRLARAVEFSAMCFLVSVTSVRTASSWPASGRRRPKAWRRTYLQQRRTASSSTVEPLHFGWLHTAPRCVIRTSMLSSTQAGPNCDSSAVYASARPTRTCRSAPALMNGCESIPSMSSALRPPSPLTLTRRVRLVFLVGLLPNAASLSVSAGALDCSAASTVASMAAMARRTS